MNAETRAKEIVGVLVELPDIDPREASESAIRIITSALRQAENDKLEEARLIASAKIPKDVPRDEYERGRNNAACEISIEIERLKSDQPLDIVKVGTVAFERGLNSKRKD